MRGVGNPHLTRRSRSTIDRNPALAAFLTEWLNVAELGEAREECMSAFGPEITQSLSAIQRYWHRLRVEQAVKRALEHNGRPDRKSNRNRSLRDVWQVLFADDLVTMTAGEYVALKNAAAAGHLRKSLSTYRTVSKSTIARKPELAYFIVECAATLMAEQVHEAYLNKFAEQTPSRSSIFRFIRDMKNAGMVPGRHADFGLS